MISKRDLNIKYQIFFQSLAMTITQPKLKFWLQTTFQNNIEVALQLSQKPCPQETPYENKYQAIEKLKQLLSKEENPYKFIIHACLGQIYSDVEQTNDSIKSYQQVLKQLSALSLKQISKFYQQYIIAYNMLGLSYINRDENQEGLGCLCKAYEIYESFHENPGSNHYHNRPNNSGNNKISGKEFNFFYQGGNDYELMDQYHTLTLFYMAQAYTKLGLKDKAAEFCGMTLQRQYATDRFEIKEFCNNLIGLSEYYTGNKYYAQAEYILLLALKVLPEGKKKKMRALIQIELGKVISEILEHSVDKISQKIPVQQSDNVAINRQCLKFRNFDQNFPQLKLAVDIEECKSYFRKANTIFKKSMEVFVLDGFVTEHLQILTEMSKLYRSLSVIEKSRERVFSMLTKRKQLLEPILTELNPKAYPAFWQKTLVQVSQIYNDLFNIKNLIVTDAKTKPTEAKLEEMNRIAIQSVSYYEEIVKVLLEDKDTQRNEQYFRSIINSKFNIAKAQSKCLSLEKKVRVEFLKESYKDYQELARYIQKDIDVNLRPKYSKQLQLTNEMVAMLPTKIDKINAGMISPLE